MKSIVIKLTGMMLAAFVACGCMGDSSETNTDSSAFSLIDLYDEDCSRLRFTTKNDERQPDYQKVSERWMIDLIVQVEMSEGIDTLY